MILPVISGQLNKGLEKIIKQAGLQQRYQIRSRKLPVWGNGMILLRGETNLPIIFSITKF